MPEFFGAVITMIVSQLPLVMAWMALFSQCYWKVR